jgi:tungstate transport system ATP-binding protein
MEPLYYLKDMRKNYGSRQVLAIDGLAIRGGCLYTLTGANGSGKSTLLHILAFLSPPTAGEVWFAGERADWNAASLLRLRRSVTLLHQDPYLFDESVSANVAFGLKVRGIAGREQHRLVDQALEMVGLTGFQKRKARELSGGEAQRVAMARSLAVRPQVLLLDEPLANVDKDTAELLERVIVALPELGTAVIMTTHDPEHPERLGGELIRLVAGELGGGPDSAAPILEKGENRPCRLLSRPAASSSTG